MRWIFRYFLVCVSFTNLVIAEDQCRTEINIRGMALRGFVFKRIAVAAPHICDILCERQITCQSYNFNRKEQICELNNRTKEARPENFHSDPAWFYIRRLNGRDHDECISGNNICDVNAYCTNTVGSYFCTCKEGSTGNGQSCSDTDECTHGNHDCDVNAECNNNLGSYNCTCKDGFHGNGTHCTDTDECIDGTHDCHMNAECNNTFGSYNCSCKDGFQGNGTICTDIDECTRKTGKHSSEGNTTCNNTNGSYTCSCKHGYRGNGTNCTNIDECANRMHNCDVNAKCNNTLGSYSCTCKDGFHGNGTNCTDIDECASGTHICDVNAECNNTLGSYNCTCKYGFDGNGTNCNVKVWPIIICESNSNRIRCENERKIDIVYANYGRLDRGTCNHTEMSNTNCRSKNSLSIVQTKCNGTVSCQLVATNSEFGGDPCGGTLKYLEVKYKCVLIN